MLYGHGRRKAIQIADFPVVLTGDVVMEAVAYMAGDQLAKTALVLPVFTTKGGFIRIGHQSILAGDRIAQSRLSGIVGQQGPAIMPHDDGNMVLSFLAEFGNVQFVVNFIMGIIGILAVFGKFSVYVHSIVGVCRDLQGDFATAVCKTIIKIAVKVLAFKGCFPYPLCLFRHDCHLKLFLKNRAYIQPI